MKELGGLVEYGGCSFFSKLPRLMTGKLGEFWLGLMVDVETSNTGKTKLQGGGAALYRDTNQEP